MTNRTPAGGASTDPSADLPRLLSDDADLPPGDRLARQAAASLAITRSRSARLSAGLAADEAPRVEAIADNRPTASSSSAGSKPRVAPGRLPATPAQQAAVATMLRNYTRILFELIERRADDDEAREVIHDIHHAFLDRSLGRLDKCVTLGQSLRTFISELARIDPLKLSIPRLHGVDPQTEYAWEQIVKRLDDKSGFALELDHLQEQLRHHGQFFTRTRDFPTTLAALDAALAA